jgi:DNA-binding transcriptional ArsR family regulator
MANSLLDSLQVDAGAFASSHDATDEDLPLYEWVPYEDVEGSVPNGRDTDDDYFPDPSQGDNLPSFSSFADIAECPPARPFLIDGLLHKGDKALITSRSKAGKSMLLIQLALAVSNGGTWLGHQCNQGRVLYVNLELNEVEFIRRVFRVLDATGQQNPSDSLQVWNLRGERIRPLDTFIEKFIGRVECQNFALIILDPFYKLADGIENAAEDVAEALLRIDDIAEASGASVAYAHHHAKGSQAARSVLDRGSGSGVFARDADVLLDLIELAPGTAREERLSDLIAQDIPTEKALSLTEQAQHWTAWRLQGISRNLPPMLPRNVWFDYPLHIVDTGGYLDGARLMPAGGEDDVSEGKYEVKRRENVNRIVAAYEEHVERTGQDPTAYDLSEALDKMPRRTVQRHLEAAGFCGYKQEGETSYRYRRGDGDE